MSGLADGMWLKPPTCDVSCCTRGGHIHRGLNVAVCLVVHRLKLVAQDNRHSANALLDDPAALCNVGNQLEHGLTRVGATVEEPVQRKVKRLPIVDIPRALIAGSRFVTADCRWLIDRVIVAAVRGNMTGVGCAVAAVFADRVGWPTAHGGLVPTVAVWLVVR